MSTLRLGCAINRDVRGFYELHMTWPNCIILLMGLFTLKNCVDCYSINPNCGKIQVTVRIQLQKSFHPIINIMPCQLMDESKNVYECNVYECVTILSFQNDILNKKKCQPYFICVSAKYYWISVTYTQGV